MYIYSRALIRGRSDDLCRLRERARVSLRCVSEMYIVEFLRDSLRMQKAREKELLSAVLAFEIRAFFRARIRTYA